MKKNLILLLTLIILAGCQASGGGAPAGGIITGHTPADNKFTLTTTLNKTYLVTETINIVLNFPKAVTVAGGTPSIDITLGAIIKSVPLSSGNGTTALVFSYTVVAGDDDLDGISVSAILNKNGATIKYDTTFDTSTTVVVPNLSTVLVNTISGTPPVASNITPAAFNEDTQSIMTLSYTDADLDLATSCTLSSLVKVTVTQACACAAGVCTVGVTGTPHANGAASFSYRVTANSQLSNVASASFTMNPVADTPFANNITPAAFNEDVQSIITLSYFDGDSDQATACNISAPTNVSVTQPCACAAGVCTVGVTGTLNYSGAASFNYTVTANGDVSNAASATLAITAVGDAPVAANIIPAAFNEDIQSIITLSYSDVESDLATACTISSLTNVTVTQACACAAGTCTVGVTSTPNYNGSASFVYTVTANSQISNTASSSLTINAIDDAPVSANITPPAFNSNAQSVITLSYSDVELHTATACSISTPTNVTVTQACACAAGTCTVGVTSTLNYSGAASFNYTVTANGLVSNSALASLTINPLASAPVASNITPPAFNEDTQGTITLSYTDPNSDLATACTISVLSNVTVTTPCACAAGVCTVGVTGSANYNGAASFNYTVTANGDISNAASATLSITAVDDAPVAAAITPPAFNEDTQSIITLSYSDVDSDLATACTISSPTNVTVTQACACAAGTCTVGVTGLLNYSGAASFNYTVTANSVVSNSVAATLTISALDDAPVAAAITPPAFNEDTASTITLSYTDAESDQASSCTISALSNVTVSTPCACAAGVCTVGVTGTANYNGAASFNYTVSNALTSNVAAATLSITSVDDIPVTSNMSPASFNEDTQSIITLSYVDVDHQASACTISALANITVTQACACAAGVCTVGVTGTANYSGAASFDFTVTANSVISNASTASLTIVAVNDAPVAANITPAAFNEDVQSVITLSYTDAESDLAASCTISSPTNVSVTQACACAAGTCTVGVTGSSNYNGSASFGYTVTANTQTSNTATATLSITAVDDAPVAINITPAAFNEDTASTINLSYTDVEGDFASACTVSGLTNVTVTTACSCSLGSCSVGVQGTANYSGTASFTYTVTANSLVSNSATASLTISSVDDAPVASNITPASFNEDTQSIITLSYTDADSDLATACSITSPTNVTETQACACTSGTCTVGVTGTSNFNGTGSFSYTVTANSVVSNAATASLTISAVNDAPIISAISAKTGNMNVAGSAIAFTITDVDNALVCSTANLSMTSSNTALVANSAVAWAGTAPNCTGTITPTNDQFGTTTISFIVSDGSVTATSSFSLAISGSLLKWVNAGGTVITSYSFGTPGANTTATVYMKNIGNQTSGTISITDNAGHAKLSQTNACTTLGVGATCTVTLNWDNSGGGGLRTEIYTGTAAGSTGTSPTLTVSGTK